VLGAGSVRWQALPLGPTGSGNSPYQLVSSFAGNVLLISPVQMAVDLLVRHVSWKLHGGGEAARSVHAAIVVFPSWIFS
jgi:4-alpha-glucanotransferase